MKESYLSAKDIFTLAVIHAPKPLPDVIDLHSRMDKNNNPFNDYHKPKLRSTEEIIIDAQIEFATLQIKEAEKAFEKTFAKSKPWE